MADPKLEDVFKVSGIPTYTFVPPLEYERLLVAIRTPGRGVVIEGPSGIGKTTSITRILDELGLAEKALRLTARKKDDVALIAELPKMDNVGLVVIDDFHRLIDTTREQIADYLKTLADEETPGSKVVVVGINQAGETLISFARDLNNRIEVVRFEANPDEFVDRLITQGEDALNVSIGVKPEIVEAAHGSFYIAQMLAHETCLGGGIKDKHDEQQAVETSIELVKARVMSRLAPAFHPLALGFAEGTKLRQDGRAPYLHILKWLAEANEWSINLAREMKRHAELKGSVGQVVEKGFLSKLLIETKPELSSVLHFEPKTRVLAVEDPQFVFFIRNLAWNEFAAEVGFSGTTFESRYDIALSFAGPDRQTAERLFLLLAEQEFEVFYDRNEQHRILAEDLEEYLAPIYRSEAAFVVVLLGPDYPKRIWTKFESDQFKERFGEGRVIPIWFTNAPPGVFDESARVGGVTFDPEGNVDAQLAEIVDSVRMKIRDLRSPS